MQFYNDDISDINGNESTLYENIARDIFENIRSRMMDDRVSGGLTLNDINFQIYVIGYIEREQGKYPDKELNFQNIYHRLSILTREAIHEYVMDRAETVKGRARKSLENKE